MRDARVSIRDALYEKPGPKTRRYIAIGTVFSLAALAVILYCVIRQFYRTGQLDERYWSFLMRGTTWKFLGKGLAGTLEAALAAGLVALALGFLMMVGRISSNRILSGISTALI